MNKKRNNIIKKCLVVLVSIVSGYMFHLHIMAEILSRFYNVNYAFIISLCGCIIIFYVLLDGIFVTKSINNKVLFMLEVSYVVFLFMLLFNRSVLETSFILNPIDEIKEFFDNNSLMLYQSLLNLIAFIPMGYFFKSCSFANMFIKMFFLSLVIELIQAGLQLGFFDTLDIILYLAGSSIGFFIFKHIKLNIEGEEIHLIKIIKKNLALYKN